MCFFFKKKLIYFFFNFGFVLLQDEITSPLGAQIFDFCESELFPETLQNSEVASSSNCCYEEQTSYQTPLSNIYNNTIENTDMPPPAAGGGSGGSPPMLLEDQGVDDISASIDFTLSPSFSVPHDQHYNPNQEPYAMAAMNGQSQLLGDVAVEGSMYASHLYNPEQHQMAAAAGLPPMLGAGMKDDCGLPPSAAAAAYNIRLRNSSAAACALSDPMMAPYLSSGGAGAPFSFDSSWLLYTAGGGSSGLLMGSDFSHQEMESQGENGGFFLPDSLARVLNCSSGDLQVHIFYKIHPSSAPSHPSRRVSITSYTYIQETHQLGFNYTCMQN